MPGPCTICKHSPSPMVKDKKGQYTFACPAHYERVTGKPRAS